MTHLDHLVNQAMKAFCERFRREPKWVVASPGRVNLIGEHTDYNEGHVLPMAIDRYLVMAADLMPDGNDSETATFHSLLMNESVEVKIKPPIMPGEVQWPSYIQGTIAGCLKAGLQPQPFEAIILSDVPVGGGLSSSAALETSTATLIEAVSANKLDKVEKALLCQQAEHEYAQMPCGIMDQFTAIMGKADNAILLDCRNLTGRLLPMTDQNVTVLITNSNIRHKLTGSVYPERRKQCERVAQALGIKALRDADLDMLEAARSQIDDLHYRRARHVITEEHRTLLAADAFTLGNWEKFGELMYESHASLCEDYEVSCPELDTLVDIARSIGRDGGVYGSRMTGAGFGGCTVSIVQTEHAIDIAASIMRRYNEQTGIECVIFDTRPGQGATICEDDNDYLSAPIEEAIELTDCDCDDDNAA